MKRIFAAALLLIATVSFGATTVPVQLLNPSGSTLGQAIVSSGPSSNPIWSNVPATSLAPIPANTILANVTNASASATAFSMPSCIASGNALLYSPGAGISCGTGYALLASPVFTGTPQAPTPGNSTNTAQLATTAFVQSTLIPTSWTSYTPTLTAVSGSYTTASAIGGYARGSGGLVCFWATATITTVGTGTNPVLGLPFATAASGNNIVITGREVNITGSLLQGVVGAGASTMTIWDYKNTNIAANGTSFQMNGCYVS